MERVLTQALGEECTLNCGQALGSLAMCSSLPPAEAEWPTAEEQLGGDHRSANNSYSTSGLAISSRAATLTSTCMSPSVSCLGRLGSEASAAFFQISLLKSGDVGHGRAGEV